MNTTLAPHQQRVVEERAELMARMEKLENFIEGPVFSTLEAEDQRLLAQQRGRMAALATTLERRIHRFHGAKRYTCHKEVLARPMTRGDYNSLRGWAIPATENPLDEGYLVEYTDGGEANHPNFAGYISWSPKDVFDRGYTETS